MLDPRSGTRCAIQDTRAAGAGRYYWAVIVFGEPDPVADGRTGDIGAVRSRAEVALGTLPDEQERLGWRNGTHG